MKQWDKLCKWYEKLENEDITYEHDYALFDTLVISKMSVLDRSLLYNENFNS